MEQLGPVCPTVTLRIGLTNGSRRPAAEIFFAAGLESAEAALAVFCVTLGACFLATTGFLGAGLGATATTSGFFCAVAGFAVNGPPLDALVFCFGLVCGATATAGVLPSAGVDFVEAAPVFFPVVVPVVAAAPDFG